MNTHVGRASDRVAREREAVGARRRAYGRFRSRVEAIRPRPRAGPAGAGEVVAGSRGGSDVTEPIREAFVETVAATLADRPVAELLAAELGEGVATAIEAEAPSPSLRRAVLSESDRRRAELAAMDRALEAEAASLSGAKETIESTREWLVDADGTALSACGFDELRARHERLAEFREDCERTLAERQEHLGRTTSVGGRAGVRQRDLVDGLYGEFPIDYPVLVTLTRLEESCVDCQRVVRDHLVRRA